MLCASALLSVAAAGSVSARLVCDGNLVADWEFRSKAAWTAFSRSPDFAGAGGYVGMWGNREVGEAISQQLGGGGLVAGKTYVISLRARHVVDPGKQPYSQVRLVGWPAGAPPTSYKDLLEAPQVVQIGESPRITSTDWTPVSFGPWTAPSDLASVALHVVNEYEVDDGGLTSYANLDYLCIRELVPPTLCGTKYRDDDCDGGRGAGEAGLDGWEILLTGADGEVRTTTTGPDGGYCFDDLAAGGYRVAEKTRPGWVQTAPRSTSGEHHVTLGREGDVDGIDFGNQLCGRCPSDCADPRDPRFEYVIEDPATCERIRYVCDPGEEYFSDACGCGCVAPCERSATAAGLHYPGETCSTAVPLAEASLDSAHYRSACSKAYGDMPAGPVGVRAVTDCRRQDDGVVLEVEVCCPVPPGEPDLNVGKELVGPTDNPSIHLVFRITVKNVGSAPMPGPVEVRDALPEGYRFVSGPGCTSADGQQVDCTHTAGLAAGESATFEVVTELDRSAFQDRTNCATLVSDAGRGDPSDDTACLPLSCPDRGESGVHYLVERPNRESHARCPRLLGRCGDGQRPFWGACGCGCIDEPECVDVLPRAGEDLPPLDAAEPAADLSGLLKLPRRMQPGDRLVVTPLDPHRTPPDGTWRINGRVIEPTDPQPAVLCPRDWWTFDVPLDWRQGVEVAVTYTDPGGDVLVDAKPDVDVGEPVEDSAQPPFIEGGTVFTVPGGEACVCGSFPTLESRSGLLLDDRALGTPDAGSRQAVHFRVPADEALGDHRVTGWPEAGFVEGTNQTTLGVVEVRASLDTSTLIRGGTTRLFLQVVGTTRPVTLRLRNHSPSVVVVEGGDDQTLTTSGGEENQVSLPVRGVGEGDFDLRWELPGCPCGE